MSKPQASILYGLAATTLAIGLSGYLSTFMNGVNLAIALFAGAAVFVCLSLNIHDAEDSLEKNHKKAEAVAGAGICVFLAIVFSIGILPALIALLVMAQLALSIRANNNNRIYSALVIGFVCLIVGAAEAKTGIYLIYMATFGVSGLFVLRLLNQQNFLLSAQYLPANQKTSRFFDLHLLKFAVIFSVLALMVYLFIPRLPAGNIGAKTSASQHFYQNPSWDQKADSPQSPNEPEDDKESSANNAPQSDSVQDLDNKNRYAYRGFNSSFAIDNPDPSKSRFSNELVLRVKSDVPLYLKAKIFDSFDGLHWYQSSSGLNYRRLTKGRFTLDKTQLPSNKLITQKTKSYEVFVEANLTDNIPIAEQLVSLQFPAAVIAEDDFGQWQAAGTLKPGTVYGAEVQFNSFRDRQFSLVTAITSNVTAANSAAQKMLEADAKNERDLRKRALTHYLTLPENLDARIYTLARDNAGRVSNDFPELTKAIALEHFLRTEYQYDFDSIFTSQGTTPLIPFLFETKKGHCEYFASALTVMLRTLDIPARLVTGFLAYNQNPLTGYYEVRALDGHAWVEAYVDDLGWVLLEPTAYYPEPRLPDEYSSVTAKKIQNYIKELERIDNASGHGEFTFEGFLRSLWYGLTLIVTVALATAKLIIVQLWWLWIFVGALVAGSFWLWPQYKGMIKNRYLLMRIQKMPTLSITEGLMILHRALNNLGTVLPLGLTIEQFNSCVAQSYLSTANQERVVRLFNQHYYESHDLTATELSELESLIFELLLGVLRSTHK